MVRPAYMLLSVFIGCGIGVSAGYLLSSNLVTLKDRSLLVFKPTLDEPGFVRIVGTIQSVDQRKNTVVIDAMSPYSRDERLLLRIRIDNNARIMSADRSELLEISNLSVGTSVTMNVRRASGDFHAERVALKSSFFD